MAKRKREWKTRGEKVRFTRRKLRIKEKETKRQLEAA